MIPSIASLGDTLRITQLVRCLDYELEIRAPEVCLAIFSVCLQVRITIGLRDIQTGLLTVFLSSRETRVRDDILVSRKGGNLLLSGTVKPEKNSGVNGYYELTMRPAYRWLVSSVGRELP